MSFYCCKYLTQFFNISLIYEIKKVSNLSFNKNKKLKFLKIISLKLKIW